MVTRRQQPEKAEQAGIVKLARSLGGRVYVLGTRRRAGDYQGTMQTPGIPDLLVFLPDSWIQRTAPSYRQVWIEVKAAKGRLSDDQATFQGLCAMAGVDHVVGGVTEFCGWLIREGYLTPQQVPWYRQETTCTNSQ